MGLEQILDRDLVEASVFLFDEHHRVSLHGLQLRAAGANKFSAAIAGAADIDGESEPLSLDFSLTSALEFTGLVVVPDNLEPKPETPEQVRQAVSAFMSVDDLRRPSFDKWRYLLEPDV
ncbi:hypothetical protein [Chelativorans sp.]|uniref:hypothetical protein n=1 Tax=Chelativorans sp. TaxID=2203393 RepID=UPI0028128158|nr:hypothetical protein [Chelativorans sp.]